jgi:predicted RNA-binding Zn-ribbon protein involved in translation (DUF1610 family)
MSATFASKGVTEPRHAIGDTIWVVTSSSEPVNFPCPDCHGAGVWKAISPAGYEFEVDCPRCSRNGGGFSGQAGGARVNQLPDLSYHRTVYSATSRLIVGIEIRQPPWSDSDPISYSVGGGSSYQERNTFPTEEAAQTAARGHQIAWDAKKSAEPATLEAGRFSSMQLRDAIITRQHDSLWDSWWVARHLLDDLEGWVDEEKRPTSKEDIGYMFDDLGSTVKRLRAGKHYSDPGPFMNFMDWLEAQARGTAALAPSLLSEKLADIRGLALSSSMNPLPETGISIGEKQ